MKLEAFYNFRPVVAKEVSLINIQFFIDYTLFLFRIVNIQVGHRPDKSIKVINFIF